MEALVFKMFVFHYKPDIQSLGDNSYLQIWAGKNNSSIMSGLTGDDTGDNISSKNKYYSELTGIYWAWKNNSADIWGTCHYRRFYTIASEPTFYKLKRFGYYLAGIGRKRYGLIYTSDLNLWKSKIITQSEVYELLQKYDAIMPVKRKLRYSVEEHYRRYHNIQDLNLLRSIIETSSGEYLESFDKMLRQNRLYANNMFILGNERFQELMKWLFMLLFEFEKLVTLNSYSGYQERIMGFLSERLITCWFMHHELNCKELNLIYFKKFKNHS